MNLNSKTDKLIRRTTMGVTCVAAYFLLTADYGYPNLLDPIKNAILSTQQAALESVFGKKKENTECTRKKSTSDTSKGSP